MSHDIRYEIKIPNLADKQIKDTGNSGMHFPYPMMERGIPKPQTHLDTNTIPYTYYTLLSGCSYEICQPAGTRLGSFTTETRKHMVCRRNP